MTTTISRYLSRIGKRGGAAGRGKVKARTRAQAQAAARARWAKVKQLGAHNAHDQRDTV